MTVKYFSICSPLADPGFPVGEGGADLQRGHFSAEMYVKTKELGPVEGGALPRIRQCSPWANKISSQN